MLQCGNIGECFTDLSSFRWKLTKYRACKYWARWLQLWLALTHSEIETFFKPFGLRSICAYEKRRQIMDSNIKYAFALMA